MPSALKLRDPLLFAARIVVGALMGLVILGFVMVAVGVLVLLTVERADMLAKLSAAGFGTPGYVLVLVGTLLVLGLFALAIIFTLNLLRLIDSVGIGDPFVPINADRLRTMAWSTLGGEACLLAIIAIAYWFGGVEQLTVAEDALNTFFNGLLLTLVLFILARVFRRGTEMRDELEGTV